MENVFPAVRTKETAFHSQKSSYFWQVKVALNRTRFSLRFPCPVFAAYKGDEKSRHF